MSRLRFAAVLFAASSFGVILLAASASSSRPPAVYGAGDEWRAAPASNEGTHQTLSKWAMTHRFYIGDGLDFKRSNDSVLLVHQGDYERCSAASPPARRFADGGGGDTRFTLAHPGLFYFISAEPARCEAGQRMVVRAVDPLNSGAPTPTPAPAPGAQPAPRRRPLSIAQKQMVAGALGFAAGFITVFLLIGFFIICCCP